MKNRKLHIKVVSALMSQFTACLMAVIALVLTDQATAQDASSCTVPADQLVMSGDFSQCDFENANLSNHRFSGIRGTNFSNSNLKGAVFPAISDDSPSLKLCFLIGKFEGAIIDARTVLPKEWGEIPDDSRVGAVNDSERALYHAIHSCQMIYETQNHDKLTDPEKALTQFQVEWVNAHVSACNLLQKQEKSVSTKTPEEQTHYKMIASSVGAAVAIGLSLREIQTILDTSALEYWKDVGLGSTLIEIERSITRLEALQTARQTTITDLEDLLIQATSSNSKDVYIRLETTLTKSLEQFDSYSFLSTGELPHNAGPIRDLIDRLLTKVKQVNGTVNFTWLYGDFPAGPPAWEIQAAARIQTEALASANNSILSAVRKSLIPGLRDVPLMSKIRVQTFANALNNLGAKIANTLNTAATKTGRPLVTLPTAEVPLTISDVSAEVTRLKAVIPNLKQAAASAISEAIEEAGPAALKVTMKAGLKGLLFGATGGVVFDFFFSPLSADIDGNLVDSLRAELRSTPTAIGMESANQNASVMCQQAKMSARVAIDATVTLRKLLPLIGSLD